MKENNYKEIFNTAYRNQKSYYQLSFGLVSRLFEMIGKPETVLDLGCGKEELSIDLAALGASVTAVDFSVEAFRDKKHTEKVTFIQSDMEEFVNFSGKQYGGAFLKLVIRFIENPEFFFKKLLRIVKFVVIVTPVIEEDSVPTKKEIEISVVKKEFENMLGKICAFESFQTEEELFAYICWSRG
jgi:ubiquinone/menaquinone biosynthesis C-methylase UbiE